MPKKKDTLPPSVLKDMLIGGKTQSPLGNLGLLAATAGAVKATPAALLAGKNLLKNEVPKMTMSDAAFKKGLLPKLTKKGIENWQHLRPWNAFLPRTSLTPGGTLQTLPTRAAGTAVPLLSLLIDKLKKKK